MSLRPPTVSCVATVTAAGLLPLSTVAVEPWGMTAQGPLRTTVIVVIAALAVGMAALKRDAPVLDAEVRTGRDDQAVSFSWLLLIMTMAVAATVGDDPLHGWAGTPDRRLGVAAWVGFAGLWWSGRKVGSAALRVFSYGAVLTGWMLTVAAVLEATGLFVVDSVSGRIGGLHGQPAYTAAVAVIVIPVTFGVAFDPVTPRWGKPVAVSSAVGTVVTLAATLTRGGWLGVAAAAIVLGVHQRHRVLEFVAAHRVQTAVATVVILLGLGVVSLATPVGPRVASAFDVTTGTTAGRVAEWHVATRIIAEHPLSGVGPEGYRIAFLHTVDAEYVQRFGREAYTDRAHSAILDVTATGGVFGGLAYVVLIVSSVAATFRRLDTPVRLGAAGAVIGYVVSQTVLFPLAEVDGAWWLLVGMITAPVIEQSASPHDPDTVPVSLRHIVISGVCFAVAAGSIVVGSRGVAANYHLGAAAASSGRDRYTHLVDARELRPDDVRIAYVTAQLSRQEGTILDLDAAITATEAGLAWSPNDPPLRTLRTELLVERAVRSGVPVDGDVALSEARIWADVDPNNPKTLRILAEALRITGHDDEAETVDAAVERLSS